MNETEVDRVQSPQETNTMAYRDIFDELKPNERVNMLQRATNKACEAGEIILEEGKRNRSIYVIVDGEVEIRRNGHALATLGLGSIFGEMAFLSGEPASATVIATSKTQLLQVEHESILALIEDCPEFGTRFYRSIAGTLASRLKYTSEKVQNR